MNLNKIEYDNYYLTLNTYGVLFFCGVGFSTNISLLRSENRKSDSVRSQMFGVPGI